MTCDILPVAMFFLTFLNKINIRLIWICICLTFGAKVETAAAVFLLHMRSFNCLVDWSAEQRGGVEFLEWGETKTFHKLSFYISEVEWV